MNSEQRIVNNGYCSLFTVRYSFSFQKRISTTFNDVFVENTRYHFEADGSHLPSGVYFLVVNTPDFRESKKMVLLK